LQQQQPLIKLLDGVCDKFHLKLSDLQTLASNYPSLPVHPTQPYSMLNAFMLSWLLAVMFYRRERHGGVFGAMILLYSITRFLEECIRQDSPLDVANLTLSQSVCVGMFVFALLYFVWVCRSPLKSPRAEPFVWEESDEKAAAARA